MGQEAVALWNGGKDSTLAAHLAAQCGKRIISLATFAPEDAEFLAHPLDFMGLQAEAMGLPHKVYTIKEPYKQGYVAALKQIKASGADTVITGDITEINGHPNWVRECCQEAGLEVQTPLWAMDREEILRRLFDNRFKAIFSLVKRPWLTEEWVGRELNEDALARLRTIHDKKGLDLCGENGEYHTLVLDGPTFKQSIKIKTHTMKIKGDSAYLEVKNADLHDK